MSSEWEKEFDQRQYKMMLNLLDAYTESQISLMSLIPKIEFLLHSLHESSSEGDLNLFEELSKLEEFNAIIITSEQYDIADFYETILQIIHGMKRQIQSVLE